MNVPDLRAAVSVNGGTPTRHDMVGLLRQLVTAYGGTPTQYSIVGLLREAVTAAGGTPTQWSQVGLMRELVTALGVDPAEYAGRTLSRIVAETPKGGDAPTSLVANPGEATEVTVGAVSGAHQYDVGSLVHYIEGKGSPQSLRVNVSDDGQDFYDLTTGGGDNSFTVIKYVDGSGVGVVTSKSGLAITSTTLIRISIDALNVVRVYFDGVLQQTSGAQGDPRYENVATGPGTSSTDVKYGGDLDLLSVAGSSYDESSGDASFDLLYFSDDAVKVFISINGDPEEEATIVSNPVPGEATVSIAVPSELKGSAPEFTIVTKTDPGGSTVATEIYDSLYIPTVQALGVNFGDVAAGWNVNAVSNKSLGPEWQDTNDYSYAFTRRTDPTYIAANYYPLQMPPVGDWYHKLMQPGASGTRFRVEFNSTDVVFSVANDVSIPLGAQQTGGGKKWQDFTFSATDLSNAYPSVTITDLGTSTALDVFAIDAGGVRINSGFWDEEFIGEYSDPDKWPAGWRNMDFARTNANIQTFDWTDRMGADDFLSGYDGYMSLERQFELMQLLGKPSWYCIPWGATDDYVEEFCDLLLTYIGSLTVILELGNEVWNSNFTVWAKARDEGIAADVRMPNGSVPTGDHDFVLCRYAQRVAHVMGIVTTKFTTAGKMSQLVRFAGLQPVEGNIQTVMDNYSVSAVLDAMGSSAYYGNLAATTANGVSSPTTDLTVIFDRMENDPQTGLHHVWSNLTLMKAAAIARNKRFIVYEIGQEALGNDSVELLVAEDPRTKTITALHLQKHADICGDAAFWYQDYRAGGKYGLRSHPWQDREDAPRYDAALDAMGL